MVKPQPHPQPAECLDMLRRALGAHQSGQLAEAEKLYATVLAAQPYNFDALHLYGVLVHQRGQHAQALGLIAKALKTNDRSAAAHSNYGNVLAMLSRREEAVASFDQALALAPDFANALLGQGNVLYALGRLTEALASYDRLLALVPNSPEVLNNRGNTLWALRRPADALASYDAALAIAPDECATHNNRGNALLDLNRTDEALASFDRGLALKSDYPDALVNRGNALRDLNRDDEALASFERAIALNPQLAEAHWNKALLHLSRGNYEKGWPGYEWRWRRTGAAPRDFAQAQWHGESLQGKTILLHAEQGFGDVIQFARYIPLVAARGAKIILEVPDALMPLLEGIDGVTAMLRRGAPLPPFDLHCPLMSLPLAFGTSLPTIPAAVPYLRVPDERMKTWCARLPQTETPRVGIVWSGKPSHNNDHNRSLALVQLTPLLAVPGVEFVSLQRDIRDTDRAALANLPGLSRLHENLTDFADTAAIITQLDLVISADTAVAHLAGALGKPVWILLPFAGDWRWLIGRDDSPWYPTARLFRQSAIGDWDSVIAGLVRRLAQEVAKP